MANTPSNPQRDNLFVALISVLWKSEKKGRKFSCKIWSCIKYIRHMINTIMEPLIGSACSICIHRRHGNIPPATILTTVCIAYTMDILLLPKV